MCGAGNRVRPHRTTDDALPARHPARRAPFAGPGPQLLDRLLAEVAVRHRAVRRRVLYAVAASVVVALAGPVLAMMAGGGSGGGESAVRVTATDEKSGVWAQVTTENEAWGSHVQLEVKDGAGPAPAG